MECAEQVITKPDNRMLPEQVKPTSKKVLMNSKMKTEFHRFANRFKSIDL
jgi:hypothetical protein